MTVDPSYSHIAYCRLIFPARYCSIVNRKTNQKGNIRKRTWTRLYIVKTGRIDEPLIYSRVSFTENPPMVAHWGGKSTGVSVYRTKTLYEGGVFVRAIPPAKAVFAFCR